jgi:hypothetical protein
MKKAFAIAMIAAALTGCSTTSLVSQSASWAQGADKVNVSIAPEWFTMHLVNDGSNIFAVATEYSADYQFAIDKAMLAAKAQLAAQVNNRIKMDTETSITEEGSATDLDDIDRNTKRVTKSTVDSTLIVGFKRDKLEVRQEGRGYRVFIRLVYDYTENNKIVQQAQRLEKRKAKDMAKNQDKSLSERARNLPHNTISDAGVKSQVEQALSRGDAVILTDTVR